MNQEITIQGKLNYASVIVPFQKRPQFADVADFREIWQSTRVFSRLSLLTFELLKIWSTCNIGM